MNRKEEGWVREQDSLHKVAAEMQKSVEAKPHKQNSTPHPRGRGKSEEINQTVILEKETGTK